MEKHVMQYQTVHFTLNGEEVERTVDVRASLTDMLRNDYRMTSVKKGCEVGECGACTVIINGEAFNSCIYLAVWAEGKNITTLEGLLDICQLAVGAQKAFQGADLLAVCPNCQIDAGVEGLAVNEDGASTAFADFATLLNGGHAEIVAEHICQAGADVNHLLNIFAVEVIFHKLILVFHYRTPPARFTDSTMQRFADSTATC